MDGAWDEPGLLNRIDQSTQVEQHSNQTNQSRHTASTHPHHGEGERRNVVQCWLGDDVHAREDELVVQQHDHGEPAGGVRKQALQPAQQAAQQRDRQRRRDGAAVTAGARAQRPRFQQLLPASALPAAAAVCMCTGLCTQVKVDDVCGDQAKARQRRRIPTTLDPNSQHPRITYRRDSQHRPPCGRPGRPRRPSSVCGVKGMCKRRACVKKDRMGRADDCAAAVAVRGGVI